MVEACGGSLAAVTVVGSAELEVGDAKGGALAAAIDRDNRLRPLLWAEGGTWGLDMMVPTRQNPYTLHSQLGGDADE